MLRCRGGSQQLSSLAYPGARCHLTAITSSGGSPVFMSILCTDPYFSNRSRMALSGASYSKLPQKTCGQRWQRVWACCSVVGCCCGSVLARVLTGRSGRLMVLKWWVYQQERGCTPERKGGAQVLGGPGG